ncbi:MAG: hypothetical protein KUG76_04950 [Gammaproteobacteria bacterium]|nr:hypothetical protein [Gammaproteobacteria bacterium]
MKMKFVKKLVSFLFMSTFSFSAFGAENFLDLTLPESEFTVIAMSDGNANVTSFDASSKKEEDAFVPSLFTANKIHQYLGIGALGLVALAAISPKEEGGAHEYFATGSAFLASAAATTGLIYHWDDFELKDGLTDPDNMHMILAGLGTLAMVAAVAQAPGGGHAGLGATGGILMGTAIKITW